MNVPYYMTHCKPDLQLVVNFPHVPLVILSCPKATELPFIFSTLSSQRITEPVWKSVAKAFLFLFFPLSVVGKVFCLIAVLS